MNPLRIGTRGSRLALWQANHIADLLRPLAAPQPVELVIIETVGDQVRDVPLAQIGGDGLFTKEIQNALLAHTADVAVHSLKDLPTFVVKGLTLAAVPQRAPTGDAFISERHCAFENLPPGAVVATSSLRRRAFLLNRRPDLRLVNIRGNVETRLRKLHDEGLDATVLAEAGLRRLGLEASIVELLDQSWMLPAVGQGALALECRSDDGLTLGLLEQLNHTETRQSVLAERELLRTLGGGCQVPLGVVTRIEGQTLSLRAAVLRDDGTGRVEAKVTGPIREAEALGQLAADKLLAQGARVVL
jgi:hydroxymethylbilane synthase